MFLDASRVDGDDVERLERALAATVHEVRELDGEEALQRARALRTGARSRTGQRMRRVRNPVTAGEAPAARRGPPPPSPGPSVRR